MMVLLHYFLILHLPFVFGGSLDLDDLYACDELYCPDSNGGVQVPTSQNLQDGIGLTIQVDHTLPPRPKRMRVIFSDFSPSDYIPPKNPQPQSGKNPSPVKTNNLGPSINGNKSNQLGATHDSPFEKSSYPRSQGTPLNQTDNPVQGSKGAVRVGGLLYANDMGATSEPPHAKPSSPSSKASQLSAVMQNRANANMGQSSSRNSNKNSKQHTLEKPFGHGGRSSPYLSSNNGSSRNDGKGKPAAGSSQSVIERIARGLGLHRFFGVSGASRQASGKRNTARTSRYQKKTPIEDSPLKDPRSILQAQLDKHLQRSRGLASQLEFGSAESSLFRSMCQHYIRYAKSNDIPIGQQGCPQN